MALAAFSPSDPSTALVYLAGFVCFVVAAFVAPAAGKFPGGAVGLIALGQALWLFPTMWNTMEIAF